MAIAAAAKASARMLTHPASRFVSDNGLIQGLLGLGFCEGRRPGPPRGDLKGSCCWIGGRIRPTCGSLNRRQGAPSHSKGRAGENGNTLPDCIRLYTDVKDAGVGGIGAPGPSSTDGS
jgi:hypothetical protein